MFVYNIREILALLLDPGGGNLNSSLAVDLLAISFAHLYFAK